MEKTILKIIFLLCICFRTYTLPMNGVKIAEPTYYKDMNSFKMITFYENNKIRFSDDENNNSDDFLWNHVFEYSINTDDKLYQLKIKNENYSKSLLMLLSESFLVLYGESNEPLFFGASKINTELLYFPSYFEASSELHEKDIIYSGSNLKTLDLNKPWVEGAKGYGAGESVRFRINAEELIIFNGFVSKNRSYLFSQNSRLKTIDLYFTSSDLHERYELKDTPNPQSIIFEKIFNEDIILTIIDVYKGEKYTDTCLNAIILKY